MITVISWLCRLAIIILLIFALESVRESKQISISKYKISNKKIKNNIKIAVISDVHNKVFGKDNTKLFQIIKNEKPDMVLIPGDVIVASSKKDASKGITFLNTLSEICPVFVSRGNHELRAALYEDQYGFLWETLFENTKDKVNWLVNTSKYLQDKNITVYGLDIDKEMYRRFKTNYMSDEYVINLLGEVNEQTFNILLAHNPDYFHKYSMFGADLTLSGHIHGGMVILPVIGGLLSPMIRLFPKYYKGKYESNGKTMILSSGLGNHSINFRVNNKPEIIFIDLFSKEQ